MPQLGPRGVLLRFSAIAVVALLHLLAYLAVTRVNAGRPEGAFWNLATGLDSAIPHLPSTWPLYWLVYPFVPIAGGVALLRLSDAGFKRAIVAYSAMLLIGAAIQLLVPARAPWPDVPAPIQHFYHTSGLVLPYANLPSMHVAFATLTAAMLVTVVASRSWRLVTAGAALLITIGTLTLKEHFVLDAICGVLLGLVTWRWWYAPAVRRGPLGGGV